MTSLNDDKDLWSHVTVEELERREEYVAMANGCCWQICGVKFCCWLMSPEE